MNKHQQLNFVAFFQQLYDSQIAIDALKKQLLKIHNYSPNILFDKISEEKQFITPKQFLSYLDLKIKINDKQLNDIFCKFDWSRKGTISRKDFLNQIYPRGYKIKNSTTNGIITIQVQALFAQLIRQYISRFRILQVARKQIAEVPPYYAFDHITKERKGVIGQQQLRQFLQANDIDVTNQQLDFLMYGLRRRIYSHINLEVFCQNLNPLQFGMYETFLEVLRNDQQQTYLRRSRKEDDELRRSRVDTHKIANEQRKIERRKIAQLQKEKEISESLRNQELKNQQVSERLYRKQLLQTEKRIRWNLQEENLELIQRQRLANIQRERLFQIQAIKRVQQNKNAVLNQNLYENEINLQKSRSKIQYERSILQQQQFQNNIKKQRLLRQARRQQQEQALQRQLIRKKIYEQSILKQRENIRRCQQIQRLRLQEQAQKKIQRQRLQRLKYEERILLQNRLYQQQKLLQQQRQIHKQRLYNTKPYNYNPIQVPSFKYQQNRSNSYNMRLKQQQVEKKQDEFNINYGNRNEMNNNYIGGSRTPFKDYELDKTRTDLQSKKKRLQEELRRQKVYQYRNLQSNFKDRQLKRSYLI